MSILFYKNHDPVILLTRVCSSTIFHYNNKSLMLSIHRNTAIDIRLPGMYHIVMNYDILFYEKTTVCCVVESWPMSIIITIIITIIETIKRNNS